MYKVCKNCIMDTTDQDIYFDTGANASDECGSGTLFLFSPSSTTFVKHFMSVSSSYGDTPRAYHNFMAGYCNTTSAIDGVDFKFSSGNIDSGQILLFGLNYHTRSYYGR